MSKRYQNYSAFTVIKQPGTQAGAGRIFDFKEKESAQGALLVLAAIETSDKDNEKIIKIIADEFAKQFFNSLANNIEFAFENALARVNITAKDILLTKPKNWLNKIHILALAQHEQEVHLAAVGQMRAYLVHLDRLVEVITPGAPSYTMPGGQRQERGVKLTASQPNPLKLFSNIVSGRLLPS